MFAMVMLAQMTDSSAPFETVADRLEKNAVTTRD